VRKFRFTRFNLHRYSARVKLLPALAATLIACGPSPRPAPAAAPAPAPPAADVPNQPAAGVADPALAALLTEHWDAQMAMFPTWATALGDRRFDDRLTDYSAAGTERQRALRQRTLARARALPAARLSPADQLTLRILIDQLERDRVDEACRSERWNVSGYQSPVRGLDSFDRIHTITSASDGDSYLARVRAAPAAIDAIADQLAGGAAEGLTASRENVTRAIARLDEALARPVAGWSLAQGPRQASLDAADRDRLVAAVEAAIADGVVPAYRRLRATLADRVLPVARTADGMAAMPGGAACYTAALRSVTGLELDPRELHAWGQRELATIEAEMLAIARRRWKVSTFAEIRGALARDRSAYFTSEEEILAAAHATVERARARGGEMFHQVTTVPMEIAPYPPEQMAHAGTASYSRAAPDGSRPARFNVVTRPPERQGRWLLEVTALHEGIPGHHQQIATAMLLGDLPAFRRFGYDTAYTEGWGLYTETLVRELDLYSDELAWFGAWSLDALRAGRLVVDTGMHALGWTRAQAEAYLLAHTLETPEFIRNEVERYLSWPAQAVAYKVGAREILRLRERARTRLGARFDLRDFHDVILGAGPLPLPVLAERVEAWATAR
jgi:uncharacterized protein (DUF885 family)